MISPYKLYVNDQYKFEVVDLRTNPDTSEYLAETSSTWKKVVTAGQRRYHATNMDFSSRPGVYILTYPDNSISIVNPSIGDYIPPGYTRVSRELGELMSGWDGARCVNRSRLVPINGNSLLNSEFTPARRIFAIYRNRPEKDGVKNWTLFHNSISYYVYMDCTESGIKCRNEAESVTISQTLMKEVLADRTELSIRVSGGDDSTLTPTAAVLLGDTPLTLQEDGTWLYSGDALSEDTLLTIQVGGVHRITSVEIVND